MLDSLRSRAEDGSDPVRLAPELLRPVRVVVDEPDRARQGIQVADRDSAKLFLGRWCALGWPGLN